MSARKRPSWDDYFKEIVKVTASRSSCERLQVGCVLVKNNRILISDIDHPSSITSAWIAKKIINEIKIIQ